ncbi:MAG: glutamate--tRNA ligase [Flavobacteriaceae bacterium]|tara:strand:+ start:2676 stop:4193 length:1518 start_codon:yes stop_codon:yes gene_type:complete
MTKKVRVRFAPSPTGGLHIGGVRTALFNYLFAKKHGGDFILRIEDTDQSRFIEGAESYIEEALKWCGIPYDEGPNKDGGYGPYRQSERKESYKKYALKLVENGHAYYAFDSSESLDKQRIAHEEKGKTFIYNAHNRKKLSNSISLNNEEVANKLADIAPYVIRFKTPEDQTIKTSDIIRGEVLFESKVLDDKVLFKSDGMPTYHLANVVDDHLMEISHVIRGEEWLPSLALHQQLYHAFGWKAPEFAHLPLIMKPIGKGKLSKRDGETGGFPIFPLTWNESKGYKEEGYLAEAVINFLALLGWNPGTEQELFSLNELVNAFELERVQKSGARFDPEKTKWFNQQYLQTSKNERLLSSFKLDLISAYGKDSLINKTDAKLLQIIGLIKERAVFGKDLVALANYFFIAPVHFEEKTIQKHWKQETLSILEGLKELLSPLIDFNGASIEEEVKTYISQRGLSFGAIMPIIRLALVGTLSGPQVFEIMEVLEKEECLKRITHIQKIMET